MRAGKMPRGMCKEYAWDDVQGREVVRTSYKGDMRLDARPLLDDKFES